jgi:hypothetical protein
MTNEAKNAMLDYLATVATKAALYSDASTEVTGVGYTRQNITWGTASGGSISDTSIPAFSIPAGQTVAIVKLFDATGTTEYASFDVTDEAFTNAGTYTITDLTLDLNK